MNTFDVHILNTMENNQDYFNILRKIKNKPNFTQRKLANELGFSLGKSNYNNTDEWQKIYLYKQIFFN